MKKVKKLKGNKVGDCPCCGSVVELIEAGTILCVNVSPKAKCDFNGYAGDFSYDQIICKSEAVEVFSDMVTYYESDKEVSDLVSKGFSQALAESVISFLEGLEEDKEEAFRMIAMIDNITVFHERSIL